MDSRGRAADSIFIKHFWLASSMVLYDGSPRWLKFITGRYIVIFKENT
ncbi:hypothetical protein JOC37_000340 [Desulfohalotomaculum tongense]|nr:hypothetical protein [Desulforadius tongensis]MBM7853968.1 hypothetical protein [Desulforadius tongensis]